MATTGPYISAAWADYDLDGDLDVFVASHGGESRLFEHVGGDEFAVATSVLAGFTTAAHGAVWGDYDNDGFPDLFVCVRNGLPDRLYHNDSGSALRVVADAEPAQATGDSIAAAWADYDQDGLLDLFVVDLSGANRLYRNEGGGAFAEVVSSSVVADARVSVGCAWGDYDNDGDPDLFVANGGNLNNELYENLGNGAFRPVTGVPVVSDMGYSVTGAWGDYDNDGDLDLFVPNRQGSNFLYQNDGGGRFTRVLEEPFISDRGESNGCRWLDYDNDGWLDLYVANYARGESFLYHNLSGGGFARIIDAEVVGAGEATGVSAIDYNRDHGTDIFATTWPGNNALFRNAGSTNHWLAVRCVPTLSNRSAYGTRVEVKALIEGREIWQTRVVESGDGWGSSDPVLLFGVGPDGAVQMVRITWPSGAVQDLGAVEVDRELTVVETVSSGPVVVPAGFAGTEDDGWSSTLSVVPLRLQEVYGAVNFPGYPMNLRGLSFRRDSLTAPFSDGLSLVTIRLSTTSVSPDELNMVFAANYGTPPVTVFDGGAVLSSPAPSLPGRPADFDLHFSFDTPYAYDPKEGNLLVEVEVRNSTGVGNVDLSNETSDSAGRVFSMSPNALQADVRDSGADVISLDYASDEPSLFAVPGGGRREGTTVVVLGTSMSGADIHYTLDGQVPTLDSPVFVTPLVLDHSVVLKAALFAGGEQVSDTLTETYINSLEVLSLRSEVSLDGQTVTLRLDGWEGFEFEIQSTPSLQQWTSHWVAIVRDRRITFVDPLADSAPARFYRLLLRP